MGIVLAFTIYFPIFYRHESYIIPFPKNFPPTKEFPGRTHKFPDVVKYVNSEVQMDCKNEKQESETKTTFKPRGEGFPE